ncbi:uncharacterized protein LOC143934962 [Lithobates pipiens]
MPSPPSSPIFLCLSFIIFLDTTMSVKDVSMLCLTSEKDDIRELSFYDKTSILFTIWVSKGAFSKTLEVSGTFNNFNWILNQDGRKTFPCTNANPEGSDDFHCRGPKDTDNEIYLSKGSQTKASLSIDINYKSRMRISGTIRNATVTLSDVEKDEGCFSCKWKEFGVSALINGHDICPDEEKKSSTPLSPGAIGGIVVGVVIGLVAIGGWVRIATL